MAKYTLHQTVNFYRNTSEHESSTEIYYVAASTGPFNKQIYLIKYTEGHTPSSYEISAFGLDPSKKYAYVIEDELSAA